MILNGADTPLQYAVNDFIVSLYRIDKTVTGTIMLRYEGLKIRQRKERHEYNEYLTIRIHRALSWLKRAEMCADDLDGRFIFLWVAFNAAYAQEIKMQYRTCEQKRFNSFVQKIFDLDNKESLHKLIWKEFPQSIRILLNNKYVFQPFWDLSLAKTRLN